MPVSKFIKHPLNPVFGDKEIGTVFDVYVTKITNGYRMDFSWRPLESLAVSFSKDGVNWDKPIITLHPNKDFGWQDVVNRNCVLKSDEKWIMWYTGQYLNLHFSNIGVAESNDGITFHQTDRFPAIIPERYWENNSVMNPCVLYENGKYRMWYSAGEVFEPNVIAYAESDDGILWVKYPVNPVLEKNIKYNFEKDRIGGCQVIKHDNIGYLMFYIGYSDMSTACICCASSEDGITGWKRYKNNPLIIPDKNSWDGDSCYKPSAVYDSTENKWRIWYNGRLGNEEYIGLAEAYGDFSLEDFE